MWSPEGTTPGGAAPLPEPGALMDLRGLRERKLAQWAMAYLAGAWLVLQLIDIIGQSFAWPETVGRVATLLLGVGFLAALGPGLVPR